MRTYKLVFTFFLSLVFLLSTESLANSTYFNFSISSIFLTQGKEYSVTFSYLLNGVSEKDFIVIPVVENSLLEIYNEESKVWVKQNDFRLNFPRLQPTMKIRLSDFSGVSTKICFDVKLLKTAEVYKTPCKTFWNWQHFLRYLDAVNDKMFRWAKGEK